MPQPVPATNAVVEIIATGLASSAGANSKNIKNIFHYLRIAGTVTPNPVNVEAQFQTTVMIPVTNLVNHRYSQVNNSVRLMNDVTNAVVFVPRALPGAITGDSMPVDNFAYVLLRTALRGKSFRGNKKFGPMSESQTTSGSDDIWNSATLVLLGLVATGMLANLTDSDGNVWTPVILSKKLSQVKINPTSLVVAQVNSILLQKRVGAMRRRRVQSTY